MRRLVEIVWMAIAAISLVEFYFTYKASGFNQDAQVFVFVFFVSVFMYFFRRRQRLRMKKRAEEMANKGTDL